MGAELRFELSDLVELFGRQLAAQRLDRLLEVLAGLAAGNGVVRKLPRERKWLCLVGGRCVGTLRAVSSRRSRHR